MRLVKEILEEKEPEVWSVSPDSTVYEALVLMEKKNIGAVVVLEGDRLVGILSERDYARNVILKGKSSVRTPVRIIMNPEVTVVGPEQSVEECMELMTNRSIRHLPVMANERLVGMISLRDVVTAILSEQEITRK